MTSYVTSNANVATVTPTGQATAVATGQATITVMHETLTAFVRISVLLSNVDMDGDGIPDDVEIANGLNPNDPVDAAEDLDGDGVTNADELLVYGTGLRNADTDGDGILEAGFIPMKFSFVLPTLALPLVG